MLATISSTLAPRDKSLTGRLKPCRMGPDSLRAGQVLGELIADVAGVEVGEYQYVCLAGYLARLIEFQSGDPGHQSAVGLKLAIDGE